MMSSFWRNWLYVWCAFVILFGFLLMGAALPATDGPTRLIYGLIGQRSDLTWDEPFRFSTALVGAVTFGWGMTLLAAVQAALMLGDRGRPVWILMVGGFLVWYVMDSAVSIGTGFGYNAISNTLILVAFLVPILRSGVLRTEGGEPAFQTR